MCCPAAPHPYPHLIILPPALPLLRQTRAGPECAGCRVFSCCLTAVTQGGQCVTAAVTPAATRSQSARQQRRAVITAALNTRHQSPELVLERIPEGAGLASVRPNSGQRAGRDFSEFSEALDSEHPPSTAAHHSSVCSEPSDCPCSRCF